MTAPKLAPPPVRKMNPSASDRAEHMRELLRHNERLCKQAKECADRLDRILRNFLPSYGA
jgi:hypothetical protein